MNQYCVVTHSRCVSVRTASVCGYVLITKIKKNKVHNVLLPSFVKVGLKGYGSHVCVSIIYILTSRRK